MQHQCQGSRGTTPAANLPHVGHADYDGAMTPLRAILLAICILGGGSLRADDSPPTFYRGINLNGPPVTIDGQDWEGQDKEHEPKDFVRKDKAFANHDVPLV